MKILKEYGRSTIENFPRSARLTLFSQSDNVTVPTKKPMGIALNVRLMDQNYLNEAIDANY